MTNKELLPSIIMQHLIRDASEILNIKIVNLIIEFQIVCAQSDKNHHIFSVDAVVKRLSNQRLAPKKFTSSTSISRHVIGQEQKQKENRPHP